MSVYAETDAIGEGHVTREEGPGKLESCRVMSLLSDDE